MSHSSVSLLCNDGRPLFIAATLDSMEGRRCLHTVTKKQANKPQSAADEYITHNGGSALHSNQPVTSDTLICSGILRTAGPWYAVLKG